jgi:hypothetical protein
MIELPVTFRMWLLVTQLVQFTESESAEAAF